MMPQEVRDEITAKVEARLAKQIGAITPEELEKALNDGWDYGQTLVNGFMPVENLLGQMARKICGIAEGRVIDNDHYGTVVEALHFSARASKRTLAQIPHSETSGEVATTAV